MPSWIEPCKWIMLGSSTCTSNMPTSPIRSKWSLCLPSRSDCYNNWSRLCDHRQMPDCSDLCGWTMHLPRRFRDHSIRTRMSSSTTKMPHQPTIGRKWKLRMPTRISQNSMGARMLFSRPNLPLRTNPLRRRLHMPSRSLEDKQRYRVPSPDCKLSLRPVRRGGRPMHLPTRTDSRHIRNWMRCRRDFQLLRSPEIRERSMRMFGRRKSCFLRNWL